MSDRRPYHSPVREQQVAETRERIVAAGSELVHGFESWNWRGLTMRAVAARAGVSERTVYRYFADETELRAAVMRRLHEEAGVALDDISLERFGELTARVFEYLASFAASPRPLRDPTLSSTDEMRRDALIGAVALSTTDWSDDDRAVAAAALDVLWTVPTYERLTSAWQLDATDAARAATWVIGLIEEAIRDGHRPDPAPRPA